MKDREFLILVVDDDPVCIAAIEACLVSEFGDSLRVLRAGSVPDAASMIAQHDFDLICLDLHMPPYIGTNAVYKIREVAPRLPIIVISGTEGNSSVLKVMAAGAAAMIKKGTFKEMSASLTPIVIDVLRKSRKDDEIGGNEQRDAILAIVKEIRAKQDEFYDRLVLTDKEVAKLNKTVYGERAHDGQPLDPGLVGEVDVIKQGKALFIRGLLAALGLWFGLFSTWLYTYFTAVPKIK